jgi:hypothetical protein
MKKRPKKSKKPVSREEFEELRDFAMQNAVATLRMASLGDRLATMAQKWRGRREDGQHT